MKYQIVQLDNGQFKIYNTHAYRFVKCLDNQDWEHHNYQTASRVREEYEKSYQYRKAQGHVS